MDLVCEHVKGFMQVAVGAGEVNGVVSGQVGDRGALTHESQQEHRLGEAAQNTPSSAGADADAVVK